MKFALLLGAVYGFLGVAFGAFGAHALRARLTPELLAVWRTAVEYQFYHALALLLVGVWAYRQPGKPMAIATVCFGIGVLLFSGSLYTLALTGIRGFGAVTPIGGLLFLCGWAALSYAAYQAA